MSGIFKFEPAVSDEQIDFIACFSFNNQSIVTRLFQLGTKTSPQVGAGEALRVQRGDFPQTSQREPLGAGVAASGPVISISALSS